MKRCRRFLLALLLVIACATWLLATSTEYTQQFANGHGWTYTQLTCGGTCTNGDATGDGNPLPSVFAKVTGRNKDMTGYFSKAYTWEQLGVPAGDTVNTVDGQWDDKAVQTAVACTSKCTAGMDIYDSANTSLCTDSTVEPDLDASGDTAGWTNHNPTGAVNVLSGCAASNTTVTLRFYVEPSSGNNASAACELRGDNYKLTITSTTPSGRNRVIVVSQSFSVAPALGRHNVPAALLGKQPPRMAALQGGTDAKR